MKHDPVNVLLNLQTRRRESERERKREAVIVSGTDLNMKPNRINKPARTEI